METRTENRTEARTETAAVTPTFALPEPEVPSEDEEDQSASPWWHRFNPWLVVLWVIGIVFCWGGWYIARLTADGLLVSISGQQWSQFASFVYQTVMFGSPMLIVLGLATLTSTVVILAARWKRR